MVPDVAKAGHSFKGAFAYYLHDKRQGDGPQPDTAARVAWTETRNLATDDPETAKRIMVATARRADELKERAGVKATGRKSTAHVYAYALAWHPDEAATLTRAEMVRAADESLRVLGADHLQAVIVAHTDRSHPHVHVILNRVDPETGKMLATSNDFRKLSDWAHRYEKERGQILTPARDPAARQILTKDFTATAEQARPAPQKPAKGPSEAAILKDISDAQKARHKAAWTALAAKAKANREAVYAAFGQQIKDAAGVAKEKARPLWSQHFREAKAAWRDFQQLERSAIGKIALSLAFAKEQQRRGQAPGRGFLSLTFAYVLSSDLRRQSFAQGIERQRLAVANRARAALDSDIAIIKATRAEALAQKRQDFAAARAALIETQNAERAKIREAWRQVYSRQGKDPLYPARQKPAPVQEQKPMKREFDTAANGLPNAGKAPTETRHLAQAAPAPSPAGVPPLTPRKAQEVTAKPEPTPTARPVPAKDWTKAATPPAATPAPAKDWTKSATDKPREIKPLPPRNKDRDRDR
jgi:Relaxase/Mobilisation nuclease domain